MDGGNLNATLLGTASETLTLQFGREDEPVPDATCAEIVARIQSPETEPAIDQAVVTWTYQRPDCSDLSKLLDGDASQRFVISAHNFNLEIYEHNWGVRTGFIAECAFTSIMSSNFFPWPKRRQIGDYVLDGNPAAGCLKFAFLREYDALRSFERQLRLIVSANQRPRA